MSDFSHAWVVSADDGSAVHLRSLCGWATVIVERGTNTHVTLLSEKRPSCRACARAMDRRKNQV